MFTTIVSSSAALRAFTLTLLTLFVGLWLAGAEKTGMPYVAASPQAQATPTAVTTPAETGDEDIFLPLVRQPFHFYLPMAAFQNAAPQPSNPFPVQEAVDASLNAYLAWSHEGDPEDDEYLFTVYLEANDETPDEMIGETTGSFLEPPFTFELDTQYYWQVVATDARGAVNMGPVWTFRTEDAPDPPPIGEMISIPANEFMMGCDIDNPEEDVCVYYHHVEIPLHLVRLDAYEIDKYEVTNGEYRACVEVGACNPPRSIGSATRKHYYDDPAFDLFPVLYVSHWDAEDYCAWVGKRLPTEAEWEMAARGSVDTRKWPWGNEPLDCSRAAKELNRNCLEQQDMLQVGSYPRGASPYGLMDVAGNAFEWVADKYDVLYYSYSPTDNPQGPDFSRVEENRPPEDEFPYPMFSIRGGSNRDNPPYMRTAHRHWGHHGNKPMTDIPYFRSFRVGFRCAR